MTRNLHNPVDLHVQLSLLSLNCRYTRGNRSEGRLRVFDFASFCGGGQTQILFTPARVAECESFRRESHSEFSYYRPGA